MTAAPADLSRKRLTAGQRRLTARRGRARSAPSNRRNTRRALKAGVRATGLRCRWVLRWAERDPREQAGAPAGGALQGERSAECLDAVGQSAETAALQVRPAATVVDDLDDEGPVVRSGAHDDAARTGVLVR